MNCLLLSRHDHSCAKVKDRECRRLNAHQPQPPVAVTVDLRYDTIG